MYSKVNFYLDKFYNICNIKIYSFFKENLILCSYNIIKIHNFEKLLKILVVI